MGKNTQIPDYVILISTLGGMVLFGLNGFVIGPVIATIFIAAWDLFSSAKEAPRVLTGESFPGGLIQYAIPIIRED